MTASLGRSGRLRFGMATRWWLYDEELHSASHLKSVKMYLLHASDDGTMRFLVRGFIMGPDQQFTVEIRKECIVYDGPCCILNSMEEWDINNAIKWAKSRGNLNEKELDLLHLASTAHIHNGRCDIADLLQNVKREYPRANVASTKRRMSAIAPKYLSIDDNFAYATAVGLWNSRHQRVVREVVEETLQAYTRLAKSGSAPQSLAFASLDIRSQKLNFCEAFRIVQAFQLGDAAANGRWQTPADIANLTSARVRTVEQLWLYNRTHRHVERPWPSAIERYPRLDVVEFLSDEIPTGPRREDGTPDRTIPRANLRIVRL